MNDDLHELAPLYALDALDADERAAFEAHLAGCEACVADVAAFAEVTAALAVDDAVEPPGALRTSVLDALAGIDQEPSAEAAEVHGHDLPAPSEGADVVSFADALRRRRNVVLTSLASVAAVLVLVVGAVTLLGRDATASEAVFAASDAQVTTLGSAGGDASGAIELAWSRELGQLAVRADDLAGLADDRVYELWAIVEGQPMPAAIMAHGGGSFDGVFDAGPIDAADVAAWGVTVEPAGGSATPTEPILYLGEA